jgi:hypothetical protein
MLIVETGVRPFLSTAEAGRHVGRLALLDLSGQVSPARICGHGDLAPAGGVCARCRDDERERYRRRGSSKARAYGYRRKRWQELRRARLALDSYLCRLRLPGCTLVATHVHLQPELGGNHDVATLADCVSACAQCSGAIDAPRAGGRGAPSRSQILAPPRTQRQPRARYDTGSPHE